MGWIPKLNKKKTGWAQASIAVQIPSAATMELAAFCFCHHVSPPWWTILSGIHSQRNAPFLNCFCQVFLFAAMRGETNPHVITDITRKQIQSEILNVTRSWMKLHSFTRCHSDGLSSTSLCYSLYYRCLSILPTSKLHDRLYHLLFFTTTSSHLRHKPRFLQVCFQLNGTPSYHLMLSYEFPSSQPHPSANIPENTLGLHFLHVCPCANSGPSNPLL